MPRVLILTASVGEGHDRPAQTLTAQLEAEYPAAEVVVEDALAHMGRAVATVGHDAPRVVFFRWQWVWDFGFWLFVGNPVTRALTQRAITRIAAPGVLRLIERARPDVIVSVYPVVTDVLGRLRRTGRLDTPVVAVITDLAALHYWATPGADLHLVTHPESVAEVRSVAGRDAAVACVHGFTTPEFLAPRDRVEARRALGLALDGTVVLVSGGGWGVGDVAGAAEEALATDGVDLVVCLCGRNDDLRTRLETRFAGDARVRVEGFTEVMSEWLAAGDVLVHSTGGLTVLEALMRGCRAISYGWGRGHVRLNNRAFQQFGLAEVAETRADLRRMLAEAIRAGRQPVTSFADLRSAASYVVAAAHEH